MPFSARQTSGAVPKRMISGSAEPPRSIEDDDIKLAVRCRCYILKVYIQLVGQPLRSAEFLPDRTAVDNSTRRAEHVAYCAIVLQVHARN
jgi:hypothetical protein